MKQAPKNIVLCGRDHVRDIQYGGRKVGFEPFGVGLKVEDLDTGELRDSTLKDCADIMKVLRCAGYRFGDACAGNG